VLVPVPRFVVEKPLLAHASHQVVGRCSGDLPAKPFPQHAPYMLFKSDLKVFVMLSGIRRTRICSQLDVELADLIHEWPFIFLAQKLISTPSMGLGFRLRVVNELLRKALSRGGDPAC